MSTIRVAIDVMGGDNAPESVLGGVRQALDEYGNIRLLLVGNEGIIRRQMEGYTPKRGDYEVRHAPESIGMDEDPILAVRKKKQSSLILAADSVKEGENEVMVSAGNTGAIMAATKIKWGVQEKVKRPAIASLIPTRRNRYSVLIDVGANVDCSPEQLVQFGVMGGVYSEAILGREDPSIGLLNLGHEAMKGSDQVKEAYELFQRQPLNFYGNVEGGDVVSGTTDVVVCDGFVGNIALKLSEGVAETLFRFIQDKIEETIRGRIGGMLLKPDFKELVKLIDYSEYGGAPLLGLNGGCIIAHGGSSPKAIKNAIRVSRIFVEKDCNAQIGERMQTLQLQENVA